MLAILTTHPIQYQTPIWRGLAKNTQLPFKVFFMSDQGIKASFDPGFNRKLAWDIDLLEGYPHEYLSVQTGAKQDAFGWLKLKPGFADMLKQQGVKVLWVQGWQVMAYWQAIREAKKAGIQIWLRGESNLRSNKGGLKQSMKWLILKRLLNKVDYFLTIGKANQSFYQKLGYKPEQMIRAPYCIENKRFREQAEALRSDRTEIRKAWGIPKDAFCFLSVGKFIPKKRPLDIIAGIAKLQEKHPHKKVHMLWVGTGELNDALHEACDVYFKPGQGLLTGDSSREPSINCHSRVGGNPVTSGFLDSRRSQPSNALVGGGNDDFTNNREFTHKPAASFAGFLNQSEIARAYVAADALVLPSDAKETWGLVTNEAMASGLPCVVSAEVGCADDLIVPNFPELCFPMGDIDALATAMGMMMENPPTASKVQEIIDAYDCDRTVEGVAKLYNDQFGSKPNPGI